jgi:hypothetical protein
LAALFPSLARAEAAFVTSSARLEEGRKVEVSVGTRAFGVGVLVADTPSTAFGAEALFAPADRVFEVRGARQWRLTEAARTFSLSAQAGAATYATAAGPFDAGVGPEGGLALGWSWDHFSVDLGAQAGAELFFRSGGPRFPLRLVLGLGTRLGKVGLGAWGRAGVDLEPGRPLTFRLEAALALRLFSS